VIRGRRDWEPELLIREEVEAGRAVSLSTRNCGYGFPAGPGDLEGRGIPALIVGTSGTGVCIGASISVHLYLEGIETSGASPTPSILIGGEPPRPGGEPLAFGSAVGRAGDVNGDGHLDFVVGAYGGGGPDEAFIVLGGLWTFREASITELIEVGHGVRMRREQLYTYMGLRAGPAGDFDGDGLQDVLLGLPGGGPEFHGETCVVYGSPELGKGVRDIDLGMQGPWLRLVGEYGEDQSGNAVSLGDIDGDGYDDIGIVGANLQNQEARAYIMYGGPRLEGALSLGSLGARGFRFVGQAGNWFSAGRDSVSAGDLDHDGSLDVAIGEMTPRGKRVLVIFGGTGWGRERFFIRGEANADNQIDLADAVTILGSLFLGKGALPCPDAGDVDDNGRLELTDPVYLLVHLFLGASPPPHPYPQAGADASADALGPCRR
jgi:hypothetical protein